MLIVKTAGELALEIQKLRQAGGTIGLVPTMGYLHAGHLALVERAKADCGAVIVSIFVNPKQFGPQEDFANYPRDPQRDKTLLELAKADIVFIPDVEEVYPADKPARQLRADESLCGVACGVARPGHFDGVVTVVARLFDLIKPDKAFFGLKDYQQLRIVQKMTGTEKYPVEIIACPIVREPDGLALSSRNKYLSPEQRQRAPVLYLSLKLGAELLRQGKSLDEVKLAVWRTLQAVPETLVNYIEILRRDDLSALREYLPGQTVILIAAYIGGTRLIDNIEA